MKKRNLVFTALLVLSCMARAEVISINLTDNTGDGAMSSTDLAGAVSRVDNWNNLQPSSTSGNTLLGADTVFDDGTTVGGSFQVVYTPARLTYVAATANVNDSLLYYTGTELRNGESATLTLTGIPFASYEIYVYSKGATSSTRGGSFTIGSQTYYQRNSGSSTIPDSSGSGYIQMTSTDYDELDPSTVAYGNYAVFTGLSGASQTLSIATLNMGDSIERLWMNGIQIVAVPEPATIGMLGLGFVAAALIRRMTA